MSAVRCTWATTPLEIAYHDEEWGVPVHDDRTFFEFITLEGAQAGLSWETILRKRDQYRVVFDNFEPVKVARITPARVGKILTDPGIVRNRAKVESTVGNARAFIEIQREFGSFDRYVWQFVGGKPAVRPDRTSSRVEGVTDEAVRLSGDLKKRGFRFVGPTIVYAFMQATGMVNDHLVECAWNARNTR